MPIYQAVEVKISSGAAGTSTVNIDRIQGANWGYNINKTPVRVLGRFKQLTEQPVMNYSPVQFNVQYLKSDKTVESSLGIVNSTGVGIAFANTDGLSVGGFGARNLQILVAPSQSNNYNGQINIGSGVISTFSIAASVGDPVRASFAGEGLDIWHEANSAGKPNASYTSQLVRPQDITISGIDVSGYGLSGVVIQSFDLNLSISRQSSHRFGTRFPLRQVTDVNATISLRGFFEGVNTAFTGLGQYDCGNPYTGSLYFTLLPACASAESTTYVVTNPYLDSINFGAQVGSFVSTDIQFSLPISINSGEAITGSNLVIR